MSESPVVTYGSPTATATATATTTATAAVSGNVPVSCSSPSRATFPIGTTMVTCTATDSAGDTT